MIVSENEYGLAMMKMICRSFCLCFLCLFFLPIINVALLALRNNTNILQGIHIFQYVLVTHQSLKEMQDMTEPFDQRLVHFSKISSLERDTLRVYTMYISNLDPTWRILFEHLHLKGTILIFEVALQLKVDWFFSLSFSITFMWQGERKRHF